MFVHVSNSCSSLTLRRGYIALSAGCPQGWMLPYSMEIPVQWQSKRASNKKLKAMWSLSWGSLRNTGSSAKGSDGKREHLQFSLPSDNFIMSFTSGYGHSLYSTTLLLLAWSCVYIVSANPSTVWTVFCCCHFWYFLAVFLCCRCGWMCFRFSPV